MKVPLRRMYCKSRPIFSSMNIDHLIDIPRSDLIGDKSRDVPLLTLNECLQDLHHAGVEFGSQPRLVGKLAAEVGKKTSEMEFEN